MARELSSRDRLNISRAHSSSTDRHLYASNFSFMGPQSTADPALNERPLPGSGWVTLRPRSCRASSTICRSASAGSLPASLPDLLPPERCDVEIAPGAAHRLVAAVVDEVGAEHAVAVADEGVCAVPLVHIDIGVEAVHEAVPRHSPTHSRLEAADIRLRHSSAFGPTCCKIRCRRAWNLDADSLLIE